MDRYNLNLLHYESEYLGRVVFDYCCESEQPLDALLCCLVDQEETIRGL
jgi:hypothetical protein